MSKYTGISDFMQYSKLLRKNDVLVGEKVVKSKRAMQAQEFIDSHNKRELDAFLRIYDTRVFGDMLDWLVFRDAVFKEELGYSDFPHSIRDMVSEMKKIRDKKRGGK